MQPDIFSRAMTLITLGTVVTLFGIPLTFWRSRKMDLVEAMLTGNWVPILLACAAGVLRLKFDDWTWLVFAFLFPLGIAQAGMWYAGCWTELNLALDFEHLLLLALSLVAMLSRLGQIHDLFVPNWLDGFLLQNMVEKIRVQGFIPIDHVYHVGFQSLVLYFKSLLPDASVSEIILLMGQWLGILSGLSVYVWVKRIGLGWKVALVTLVLYWFLSPFPSYLVAWARYPFLAGLVTLPISCALLHDWFDSPADRTKFCFVLLSGLSLFLTHYFLFVIWFGYALFIVARRRMISLKQAGIGMILLGLVATPKFVNGASSFHMDFERFFEWADFGQASYTLGLTFHNGGWALWLFGMAGIIMLFTRHPRRLWWLLGFILFSFIVEFLGYFVFGSSATGFQDTLITFVLPLCAFAGYAVLFLIERLRLDKPGSLRALFSVALAMIVGLAAYNITFSSINPKTVLFTASDYAAMQWIDRHTDSDATFLINADHWDDGWIPCDGGAWIHALTDRHLVYFSGQSEIPSGVDYIYLGACSDHWNLGSQEAGPKRLAFDANGIRILQVEHEPWSRFASAACRGAADAPRRVNGCDG